jgi:plastocyanin/sugar lactone lactonase YvrE
MTLFRYTSLLILFLSNLTFSNDSNNPFLASYSISVTASGSSNYTLSGTDLNGSVSGDDPALTFIVGDAITFSVNASGHPFYIKTQAGTGTDNQASGVTNNGAESGDVVWTPTASGTYYYQCSAHAGMVGTITVKAKVSSISLDETIINEAGATSTLTATLSTAHSEDVIIPLTISGTASLADYSTAFATKGVKTVAGGNSSGGGLNQLNSPKDIHSDNSGNIYVADRDNGRIVKWAKNSVEGVEIITASDIEALHVDNSGNIYVSSEDAVLKYTLSNGSYSASTVAGGNGYGSALNQLNNPKGIDLDSSGNIYVSDWSNHRIMKWIPNATEGVIVAGGNNQGGDLNQLNSPADVAVDSSGNIYVSDWSNQRVMKWTPDSNEGTSIYGYVYYPISIEIDSQDNVYVVQHYYHSVRKYDDRGNYEVVLGSQGSQGNSQSTLNYPNGVHVDNSGNVYVADQSNHRIQKLQVNPEIKIASGDTTGTVTFSSLSDFDDEEDETIIITPSTSVTNAVSTITDASTITITDNDDPPSVSFALSFPSIDENSSSNVTLTATLSRTSGKSIQIPYTVGGTATETTEFTVSSSPITIPAGSTTGTVTISTNGLDDTDVEPIETIILTYGTLVNVTSIETDVTLNLLSDDKPTVDSIDINATTIEENGSTSTITATLSAVHSRNVIIPLTITGTATLDQDYETEFSSKGASILAGGNGSRK